MVQAQGEPQGDTQGDQEPKKKSRWGTVLIAVFVLIALIAIAVMLILLPKGCSQGQSSNSGSASVAPSTNAIDTGAALSLENKIHSALHSTSYNKIDPIDLVVYIFTVSKSDSGVVATISLTQSSKDLVRKYGLGASQGIASACENAVISQVPEVTTVKVVDRDGVVLSSANR